MRAEIEMAVDCWFIAFLSNEYKALILNALLNIKHTQIVTLVGVRIARFVGLMGFVEA